MPECPGMNEKVFKFGTGKGNDNIFECKKFITTKMKNDPTITGTF